MSGALRLGTRGSELAMTQSRWVAELLTAASGRDVELVPIETKGDVTSGPLAQMGGTGVFATALREALLAGECDVLVHSLKDLPTAAYPGLVVAATPERETPVDVLCSRGGVPLADLPAGARVGTGSPRRAAQVLRARPDVEVAGIRGNVDSRLRKVADGDFDAIVLAAAGLRRLNRADEITEEFGLDAWPTSAGQGALAVECRAAWADEELRQLLTLLDDEHTHLAVRLERAVLAGLEAGCAAPVGVTARAHRGEVTVMAEVYGIGGMASVRAERGVPEGTLVTAAAERALADEVVAALLEAGAADLPGLDGVLGKGGA